MSIKSYSPEHRGLTRREFLKLSSVTAAAIAALPGAKEEAWQLLAVAPFRSSVDNDRVLPLDDYRPSEGEIFQTGLGQVEVDGQMFRPVVDGQAMRELILTLALVYQGEGLKNKAKEWLDVGTLEINIYASGMLALTAGNFGPSRNGGDARISLSAETLKETKFPGSSDNPVYDLARLLGDVRSRVALPHEIQHFLGWLEHPENYGGWKASVTNLTPVCHKPFLQLAAAVLASSKLGRKFHRDRLNSKLALALAASYFAGSATDALVRATVDVHAKEKFDSAAIDRLLNEYPQIAALNLQAVFLEPI